MVMTTPPTRPAGEQGPGDLAREQIEQLMAECFIAGYAHDRNRRVPYGINLVATEEARARLDRAVPLRAAAPAVVGAEDALVEAFVKRLRTPLHKESFESAVMYGNGLAELDAEFNKAADLITRLSQSLATAERARKDAEEVAKGMRLALDALEKSEATYRKTHDRLGGDHIDTGRAWDVMRRAGDRARAALATEQEGAEKS